MESVVNPGRGATCQHIRAPQRIRRSLGPHQIFPGVYGRVSRDRISLNFTAPIETFALIYLAVFSLSVNFGISSESLRLHFLEHEIFENFRVFLLSDLPKVRRPPPVSTKKAFSSPPLGIFSEPVKGGSSHFSLAARTPSVGTIEVRKLQPAGYTAI